MDSSCFIKQQQELASLKQTLLLSSTINFNSLGRSLYHLILKLQKTTITKGDNSFTLPCTLVEVCEGHYTLEYLLSQELQDDQRYKTDFYTNGEQNIFIIDSNNSLQIIHKKEFATFHIGNTFIKLVDNNFPVMILHIQGAQRVLTNDNTIGRCVCPMSMSLHNVYNDQQKMKRVLLQHVIEFTQLMLALSVEIDRQILNCLEKFQINTMCSENTNREKRSIFLIF